MKASRKFNPLIGHGVLLRGRLLVSCMAAVVSMVPVMLQAQGDRKSKRHFGALATMVRQRRQGHEQRSPGLPGWMVRAHGESGRQALSSVARLGRCDRAGRNCGAAAGGGALLRAALRLRRRGSGRSRSPG